MEGSGKNSAAAAEKRWAMKRAKEVCLFVSFSASVCLPVCPSARLPVFLSVLSVCLSACLCFVSLLCSTAAACLLLLTITLFYSYTRLYSCCVVADCLLHYDQVYQYQVPFYSCYHTAAMCGNAKWVATHPNNTMKHPKTT